MKRYTDTTAGKDRAVTKANWRIGKSYPLDRRRPTLGADMAPQWFIFVTPPQKERAAILYLENSGADEAWQPTETRWRVVRTSKGKDKRPYEKSIAPGYVFALLSRDPAWDLLFQRSLGRVSGVIGYRGRPYPIPVRAMLEMQQVPDRIEAMRSERAAAMLAAQLAKAPREGEPARILQGPLADRIVDVRTIHDGIAWFLLGEVPVKADVGSLERVER